MENLEPDKSAVFYSQVFFCTKWCDFIAYPSWMKNHKKFLHYDQAVKPQIFQWSWMWVWINFHLGCNTFFLVHLCCKMCSLFIFLCCMYLACRSISKSPSQFSWSIIKTIFAMILPENWREFYYFYIKNSARYCLMFLLLLISYLSSKRFVCCL